MQEQESATPQLADLRTIPLGMAAWLGSIAGLMLSPGAVRGVLCATALAIGLLVCLRKWATPLLIATCGVLFVAISIAAGRQAIVQNSLVGQAGAAKGMVLAEVQLTSDPVTHPAKGFLPARAQVTARTVHVEYRGMSSQAVVPIQVSAAGQLGKQLQELPAGATVRISARASPAKPGRSSAAILTLKSVPELISQPGGLYRFSNHVRRALHEAMQWASPEQAGLVPSLVVGDVTALSQRTKDDFQTTGLTHLTAVSGTNLTLMLAFLLPLAKRLGVRRRGLTVTAALGVLGFVLICRSEPSVVRAGAMGLVALAATGLAADQRRGLRQLGTAVMLLTLLNPWLATNWGFALSVVASAAILWWGTGWQLILRRWLPGQLAEALAIPLAAQLATQPIVTYLSGQISAVGVLANILTGPFIGPVTVLGLTAGLVGSLSPLLAKPIGWLAGWCIQPVLSTAHGLAGLPAASWKWPADPLSLSILTAACLALGSLLRLILTKAWATWLLVLALIGGSLVAPKQPGWPGDWISVTCDVGQGDARAIRTGKSSAMLVDAGPEAKSTLDCLRSIGVREVSAVLITHMHADHVGGLAGVLQAFPNATVITGPATGAAINSAARETIITRAGDRFQVGWVQWRTLAADPLPTSASVTGEFENSFENDTGVAGIAEVGGVRLLFGGDREPAGQRAILAGGMDLKSDVLAMPHHGSSRQEPEFFKASQARVATASAGADNSYGHPSQAAIRLAQSNGMRVYRTDQDGSIAITKTAQGLGVVTQRRHENGS